MLSKSTRKAENAPYYKMLSWAWKPCEFVLNVKPSQPCYQDRLVYQSNLFRLNVFSGDTSSNRTREGRLAGFGSAMIPACFWREILVTGGNHWYSYDLNPTEILSDTKIRYVNRGEFPTEWIKWLLDFDPNQDPTTFKYLDEAPSWLESAINNLELMPSTMVKSLEHLIYVQYQAKNPKVITITEPGWSSADHNFSERTEKFVEDVNHSKLLSLQNSDGRFARIGPAYAAEGGFNVMGLAAAGHDFIRDCQHIRGTSSYHGGSYGVSPQTFALFNELLKKYKVAQKME